MHKMPDGTVKVLVEGNQRMAIRRVLQSDPFPVAEYDEISGAEEFSGTGADALVRALNAEFEQYVSLSKKVPAEVVTMVAGIENTGRLVDTMATHMVLSLAQKQQILEIFDIRERVDFLRKLIESELDVLQVDQRVTDGKESARVLPE